MRVIFGDLGSQGGEDKGCMGEGEGGKNRRTKRSEMKTCKFQALLFFIRNV